MHTVSQTLLIYLYYTDISRLDIQTVDIWPKKSRSVQGNSYDSTILRTEKSILVFEFEKIINSIENADLATFNFKVSVEYSFQ